MTLTQQITRLAAAPKARLDVMTAKVISQGVIKLIQRYPFYGLLIAKVNRRINPKLNSALGLGWSRHQITLEVNPNEFIKRIQTADDLFFGLEHEALHLIWLHPVRYPRDDAWTRIGTDVAVNQYVPNGSNRALTLTRLNRSLSLKLPGRKDSAFYIKAIKHYFMKHRLRYRVSKNNGDDARRSKEAKIIKDRTGDDHSGWRSSEISKVEETVQLRHLVRGALHQTNAKGRGTLPGNVRQQLWRLSPQRAIDWRKYIRVGLGNLQLGTQPSRARFNRRQAYRMDLMGEISNTVQDVDVFVDNSGSMSNEEIQFLLAQLGGFLKQFPIRIGVYSFDTQVHAEHYYQAHRFRQIKFKRIGGGGTSFQAIFNYCHHHANDFRQHLLLILTDGQGERRLNYYRSMHILWVLTEPTNKFSVRNVRGRVITLVHDPAFMKYLGG